MLRVPFINILIAVLRLPIQLLNNTYRAPNYSDSYDQESHYLYENVHYNLWVVYGVAPIVLAELTNALVIMVAILRLSFYSFQAHVIICAKVGNATVGPVFITVGVHCTKLIAKQKFRALLVDWCFIVSDHATPGWALESIITRIVNSFEAIETEEPSLTLAEGATKRFTIVVDDTGLFQTNPLN